MATGTVLVTGASGYIASHIVKQLLARGDVRVRGTVRSLKDEKKAQLLRDLVPDARYPLELVEAELLNEESWKEAVKGCSHVYHVASPFPAAQPRDENDLIRPAVEGTLNVLKACSEDGNVKRVVLTSSIAAVSNGLNGENGKEYTEADWSNEADCAPYEKSKLKAERAAWDFVEKLEEGKKFELAVINPSAVIGPFAYPANSTSVGIIVTILGNKMPALPHLYMPLVDVRDVAACHIAAMEKPEAAGNRYIAYAKSMWMKEVADVIAAEFKPMGYKIPSWNMPKLGVWLAKWFDQSAKLIYPNLDKVLTYNTEKMRGELGIEPRDANATILDTCYDLIEKDYIPKARGYRGRPSDQPPPDTASAVPEQPQAESPPTQEPAKEEEEDQPLEQPQSAQDPAKEEGEEEEEDQPLEQPQTHSAQEPAKEEEGEEKTTETQTDSQEPAKEEEEQ